MIYSMNFWIAFFVDTFMFGFQLLTFVSIYQYIDTINGWDLNQMIIFIGTFSIIDALNMSTYFFGLISLPDKIRTGTLDMIITKPIDTQFYISAEQFNPGSFLGVIVGILMVVYGVSNGNYQITVIHVVGYILLVIMMYALLYALLILIRVLAFIFIKIDAIAQAEDSIIEFAFKIPGTAFKGISRFIFLVLLPYGLIATVPTQQMTQLLEPGQWAAVIGITTFFLVLSRVLFKLGMKQYTSASS